MLITFSEAFMTDHAYPGDWVRKIAQNCSVHARVKWDTDAGEARFTLVDGWNSYKPATAARHESVILALLTLDPRATIRTSRALYKGLIDYRRQNGLAGEKLSTG